MIRDVAHLSSLLEDIQQQLREIQDSNLRANIWLGSFKPVLNTSLGKPLESADSTVPSQPAPLMTLNHAPTPAVPTDSRTVSDPRRVVDSVSSVDYSPLDAAPSVSPPTVMFCIDSVYRTSRVLVSPTSKKRTRACMSLHNSVAVLSHVTRVVVPVCQSATNAVHRPQ